MQAYMKSALPFHGVAAPLRRRLQAEAVKAHPCADTATLAATMQRAVARTPRTARSATPRWSWRASAAMRGCWTSLLPVYETMIVEGAWWDLCDEISGNALPALLQRDPATMKPLLRRWATGPQLWLRRAAMLAQRRLKHQVDAVLLYDCILPSIGGGEFADEFFIRKGIGWALRERSYQAPDEVRAFCAEYAAQLSPLTVREALKALRRRNDAPQSS